MVRSALGVSLSVSLVILSCSGTPSKGTSCTVSDNGDGTKTISCPDGTSATLSNGTTGAAGPTGTAGAAGTSCTVSAGADAGTKTITCTDGTSVTVSDGQSGATGATGATGPSGATGVDAGSGDVDAGTSDGGAGDAGTSSSGCVSLTIKNSANWCSVQIGSNAPFTDAQQTVCVTPGSVTLSASPLGGFQLGTTPWHDTAGDTGSGDPGTRSGTTATTSITAGSSPACAWGCCEFSGGGGCGVPDQCP